MDEWWFGWRIESSRLHTRTQARNNANKDLRVPRLVRVPAGKRANPHLGIRWVYGAQWRWAGISVRVNEVERTRASRWMDGCSSNVGYLFGPDI